VIVADGRVDETATDALRERLHHAGRTGSWVTHGEERCRFDALWPVEVSVALADEVLRAASGIRRFLLAAVRRDLREAGRVPTVDDARRAVAERKRKMVGAEQGGMR
jgi:hypothetical protein